MKTKNFIYFILFSLCCIVMLTSAGCKKKKNCCWSSYDFDHPVTVSPVKDTYQIGDTIWFEMNFSDVFQAVVYNNCTGETKTETVQLKDFDFHRTFLSIYELSDFSQNVTGQPKGTWHEAFNPIYELGVIIQELPDGPEYKPKYSNGTYKLKFGMICEKSGLFFYSPGFMLYYSTAHMSMNCVDINPECDCEYINDIRFPVNKQLNGTYLTNYHLFEQYMNPELENNIDRIKTQCFTFVVEE